GSASPTSPTMVRAVAERRLACVRLRAEGLSFREIGERLGLSHEAARQHVRVALRQRAREIADAADELRAGEAAKLHPAAGGSPPPGWAGGRRARAPWPNSRQRFAALLGLDLARPPEVTVSGPTMIVVDPFPADESAVVDGTTAEVLLALKAGDDVSANGP